MPVFAGGNAVVDIDMLESARFALSINHDDADPRVRLHSGRRGIHGERRTTRLDCGQHEGDWTTVYGKLADL